MGGVEMEGTHAVDSLWARSVKKLEARRKARRAGELEQRSCEKHNPNPGQEVSRSKVPHCAKD